MSLSSKIKIAIRFGLSYVVDGVASANIVDIPNGLEDRLCLCLFDDNIYLDTRNFSTEQGRSFPERRFV